MQLFDLRPSACDSTPLVVRRRILLPDARSPGSLAGLVIS